MSIYVPNSYPPVFSLKKREVPNNSLVLTKVGWLDIIISIIIIIIIIIN